VSLPTVTLSRSLAHSPLSADRAGTPTLSAVASQLLDIGAGAAGYFICGLSRVRSLCKTNPPTRAVDCRQPDIDHFNQEQRLKLSFIRAAKLAPVT